MTQTFPLKFTNHLERSNADGYCQSNIVFDFNTARMCPTGSITTQCSLSGGKQKLTVILVLWSSMQVTKGTWRMHKQCVPGSLSSSLAQEPGNEATATHTIPHLSGLLIITG